MAKDQTIDSDLRSCLADNSSLKICKFVMPGSSVEIYWDTYTGKIRFFISLTQRKNTFDALHNISYPGHKFTIKLITDHFVWSYIITDCDKKGQDKHSMQAS